MNDDAKRFATLCKITRAHHFAWRKAVSEMCHGCGVSEVVARMWEIAGQEAAAGYLKRIDRSAPLAPQVARYIVWSSQSIGGNAVVERAPQGPEQDRDEAIVRHLDCPWLHGHRRLGLVSEDRLGCDVWIKTIVDELNAALKTKLRFETLQCLPEGGPCCLRRLWVER